MKANLFGAVIASTLVGWMSVSIAQVPNAGESKHCNTMSGEQKEQCLRDEAQKTQGAPADSAAAGGTRAPTELDPRLGRSPHCDTMSGDEKVKCLEAEERKDENPPASKAND